MGSAVASFLAHNEDFNGSVLVVERDMNFQWTSTAHSNDCMRQQFANDIDILIAPYSAEYVKNLREHLGGDEEVPNLTIRNFGYLSTWPTTTRSPTCCAETSRPRHASAPAPEW